MTQQRPTIELWQLLLEAFPHRDRFPEWCKIVASIDDKQRDLSDVIEIITELGNRPDLIARMQRQHPIDRPHLREHDDNYWRVWTEAMAMAWARTVAGYDQPVFTDDDGKPDLLLAPGAWLEAKTIDHSVEEARFLDHASRVGVGWQMFTPIDIHPMVLKKFDDHFEDALKKIARQGAGALVVLYSVWLDAETKKRSAYEAINRRAQQASTKENVRIVVINRVEWHRPIIDTQSILKA